MTRLNPRDPWVIDTRELSRRPGEQREVIRSLVAPEDIGTDIVAVPAGSPVEVALRLESVSEGVLVSGEVTATAVGACVRCLEPVTVPVAVPLQELFAYADRAAHHTEVAPDSDEADVYELEGDFIDLLPVLRDTVVPALPFQPVCRADCPGLCSECGAFLAADPDHRHDVIDPRWAALGGLLGEHPTTAEERRT